MNLGASSLSPDLKTGWCEWPHTITPGNLTIERVDITKQSCFEPDGIME
jgi:hypothetical protein